MGAFRRSEEFELFGRQLGAQFSDRVLQFAGRNRARGDVVGQLFLEGEGIWLAARILGSAGVGTATALASPARAAIMPRRRKHGLQRACVVAPGIELFGADADAGLERGQPGGQHEFRRRAHAAGTKAFRPKSLRAKTLRTMPHRPMRTGSILHCHDRGLTGARIGLCRQHGVNCGDGKQAERKKSASHDGVPFSHASDK
ncbi:hypothetical protein HB777_06135 [Mesorhizobium loti]|nr:hypothetical protein HB777_06135 [Mesorhizobium loti]